jgi:hypothetical protein
MQNNNEVLDYRMGNGGNRIGDRVDGDGTLEILNIESGI